MLSHEDNELLTRVGPGTPMGEFMRRFWMPAVLSRELPEADGAPLRVRLLGEDLVAFRDSEGRVGLLEEHCPHRRASLFFGRNEECGLRCIYHGWKFDIDGNCVDLPSEPPGSNFRHKIRQTAYPTQERGGIVWAYMGPAGSAGDIPAFEWMDLPADHYYQTHWHQQCNYAQAVEGEIDSSHVSFLHSRVDRRHNNDKALTGSFFAGDTAPRWKVNETDYGMVLGARRTTPDGYYWRMNQWLFPFYTMIAPVPGEYMTNRMWVPIDDYNCSILCITYRNDKPCTERELKAWAAGLEGHPVIEPGTYRTVANKANDYLIDRDRQRTQTYSGMPGIRAEDSAMVESPGPISDRTKEHLGTSDAAVIRMRRMLIDGARALQRGEAPPAAQGGRLYAVRSHSAMIAENVDFDARQDVLDAMVV